MVTSLNSVLPAIFFTVLAVSVLSGLVMLHPRVPVNYVRIHVSIISFSPLAALIALITNHGGRTFGPWHLDSLSWLLAFFVLTIGVIVQRYSVRYLFGDRSYRKYFTLLTLTTAADSLVWLSDDLRLLLVCWGATLLGLTLLIRLNKEWHVARSAAKLSGRLFAISWLLLLVTVIWIAQATGHCQLSLVLSKNSLVQLGTWERTCINLLLVTAVVMPSAQWPFQRWLLDSVVAPTPISAVMHAGIVNAGGILLTRFAPLFSGSSAQIILLFISSVSVFLGTGIMLVHVDNKRQLVGSTIAQMGFMLIQCALGAYSAAIIHAVLHGLFKSTLFLQAGSALHHHEQKPLSANPPSLLWMMTGGAVGLFVGIDFWMTAPQEGYQLVSAIILGWSVSFAWTQLIGLGSGVIGKIAGFSFLAGAAIVYGFIHEAFHGLLQETIQTGVQTPAPVAVLLLVILLAGSAAGAWLARNRSTTAYSVIYLWLVRLGEPKKELVESHPNYLSQHLSQGGHAQ